MSPCLHFKSEDGRVSGVICRPGEFAHLVKAYCPWCCFHHDKRSRTVQAVRLVYNGWCGHDFVCGRCGYTGNVEDETLRHVSEDKREENIGMVRAMKTAGIRLGWPEVTL